MKIILSRKGFDSSSGGVSSPILPNGELISLPIPYEFSPTAFSEVAWKHRGDIGEIVASLTKGKIRSNKLCHLDPDLRRESIERQENWRPAFGQMGSEQSHLQNNGVTTGDLFLFFGLFRKADKLNTEWQFVRNEPPLHLIYGWLEIGEIVTVTSRETVLDRYPWLADHPHVNDLTQWKGDNVIYLPAKYLSINVANHERLPGAGLLRHHEQQILTAEAERHTSGCVSYWDISPWADNRGNEHLSRYNKEKNLINGTVLKTSGRWQEMVIDTEFYPEANDWARGILTGFEKFA
ncbi:MAG: hypothetical protein GXP26_03500 [Planctomycetes bacterium]|nr:hypothetical protein [Planctomycetota bacterium]